MKKFIFAALFLLGACSTAPNNPNIDTSAASQARFKTEWIASMKGKIFKGNVNTYKPGGISSSAYLWTITADGDIVNTSEAPFPGFESAWAWSRPYKILAFKSGTQAVVGYYFPGFDDYTYTEADRDKTQVHCLEVRGGKLYITAYGKFTTYGVWDKSSYSSENLTEYGTLFDPANYPKQLTTYADATDNTGVSVPFDPKKI